MKLNNVSFPYPVLGISDDIIPGLPEDSIVISCDRSDKNSYKISVSLRFENSYIEDLISKGLAKYICEFDCVKTNLRVSVQCDNPDFSFCINRRSVSGNVTLNCYVTVVKPIPHYNNPDAHPDYDGAVFDLTPGDILVGFPERSFPADPKFDKLQSVTSFMQIRHDPDNQFTNFEFTDNSIDIKLPTDLFKIFVSGVGQSYAEVIHSSIAHSALLGALYEINNYQSSMWAQAIIRLIQNKPDISESFYKDDDGNYHFTDALNIATMLLNDPYNRMFFKLKSNFPENSIFND